MIKHCRHPNARWGAWRNSLTKGVEHREKRCPDCKHVVDSEQRQK